MLWREKAIKKADLGGEEVNYPDALESTS